MTQAQANGTEGINLNRNQDLIVPSLLTDFTPDRIVDLLADPGVFWSWGYESALHSGAYRFAFSGAGYFHITFKWNNNIFLNRTTYTILVAL